jgi:hypothetical protein
MKGPGEKRTRQQEAAIVALLTAPTLTEAALQAGISEPTLRRWLQRADFQAAYRDARRALMSQAMARLQQVTATAIRTLEAIMGNVEATRGPLSWATPCGCRLCPGAGTGRPGGKSEQARGTVIAAGWLE